MSESVAYRDFSAIHLSHAEEKLLRELCGKPQKRKKGDVTEETERLEELGLIDIYENAGKERQGLFATALGKAYAEYSIKARRAKRVDLVKWFVPLVFSVIALVLAIMANVSGGRAAKTNTSAQTYRQQPAVTAAATSEPADTPQSSQTQPQKEGGASGDPSGEASEG